MKDFLNGCAVRVTKENEMEFLRMCEARGLKWCNGDKATAFSPYYRSEYYIIWKYDTNVGMSYHEHDFQESQNLHGKPFSEVTPLPHCFAEFLAGDIDLIVMPTEMPEFLGLCTEHGLKWPNGDAPRVGMRGKQTPSEGRIFYTDGARTGTLKTAYVTISYYASVKRAPVEFKYVNRTFYKGPGAKATKHREVHLGVDLASKADATGREPKPARYEIMIKGNNGDRLVTARKYVEFGIGIETAASQARCAPHGAYNFETGAVVALAKLMGRKAFEKGVAEARQSFFNESLGKLAASAKTLGKAIGHVEPRKADKSRKAADMDEGDQYVFAMPSLMTSQELRELGSTIAKGIAESSRRHGFA